MPYIKEICRAGKTEEVCKYYSARFGRRGPREKRKKPTPEAGIRANIRKQEKDLRRLMNHNFEDGVDALVTWSFNRDKAPKDYQEMLKRTQTLVRRLRKRYRQDGIILRYIYTMEIGPKGSRHIHMMISNAEPLRLMGCWGWGPVDVKPLYSDGQYAKIAAYFLKYALKTEETEGIKLGRKWNPSKNLKRPPVTKTIVSAATFREEVQERKGYYIDKDSITSGIHDVTGCAFLAYTYISLTKRPKIPRKDKTHEHRSRSDQIPRRRALRKRTDQR